MGYRYAIVGSGRQGTAAGYDMARWGRAERVIMADINPVAAQNAADRINRMIGLSIAEARHVDVTDLRSVRKILGGVDSFLSAAPYYYNLGLTQAAIEIQSSMADLGGNTELTRPPFNYSLTFHIAGLTNEYAEPAIFLRDWKIQQIEPMTELENIEFPQPIGRLEAFVTSGGTSTMPWTFEGKLRTLQNLTLRYPGHYQQLRAFWDLGLWSQEPIQVGDQSITPRQVFHALFEPKVARAQDKDMVIVRVKAIGTKDGRPAEALVECLDYYDEATDFTAMERTTGWSAALVTEMAAQGKTPRGAGGVEGFVPAQAFVGGMRLRGLNITESITA